VIAYDPAVIDPLIRQALRARQRVPDEIRALPNRMRSAARKQVSRDVRDYLDAYALLIEDAIARSEGGEG
jgi:hypothetical protein